MKAGEVGHPNRFRAHALFNKASAARAQGRVGVGVDVSTSRIWTGYRGAVGDRIDTGVRGNGVGVFAYAGEAMGCTIKGVDVMINCRPINPSITAPITPHAHPGIRRRGGASRLSTSASNSTACHPSRA